MALRKAVLRHSATSAKCRNLPDFSAVDDDFSQRLRAEMCPYEASGLGFSSATLITGICSAYLAPRLSCLRTRELHGSVHTRTCPIWFWLCEAKLAALPPLFSDLPCQLFLVPSQDQVTLALHIWLDVTVPVIALICQHAESLPAPAGEPSCRRPNKSPRITFNHAAPRIFVALG